MKKIYLIFIILCISCDKEKVNIDNTPFTTVVKFIAAESFNDTLEAEKYIDVERTYKNYIDKESDIDNGREAWIEKLSFNQSLNDGNKFHNCFKFYNYKWEQIINNDAAKVIFISKDSRARIKRIEYSLEIQNSKWRIVGLKYIK